MVAPLILLILALASPSQAVTRKYQLVNLAKTWSEAQAYCREHFADLATMDTEEDADKALQMIIDGGQNYVWAGLYDDLDGWRWSLDGSALDYTDISSLPQAFNTHKSEMHCVSWFNGGLYDQLCESTFYSVCYNELSGTYIPVLSAMTWEDAQSYCRGTHTDLTSLRGLEEVQSVSSVVNTVSNWWVGLSRGPRQWSDGSKSSLRMWEDGQPYGSSEDCLCISRSGWHDCPCSAMRRFLCSCEHLLRPTVKVFKVVLKTGGSVDLNNTQIQEGILLQMEKQMRSQGALENFRLRWMSESNGEILRKNTTQL